MTDALTWTVAGVQMDVRLGDLAGNRAAIVERLHRAADAGARLVVFPECAVTGYGFASRKACEEVAEPVSGPTATAVAKVCADRGVFAVVGMIEKDGNRIYNAAALIGPGGPVATYRKAHLPCIGADRFVDPGDRPFAVHDIGGLRLGLGICFDASFPEAARILTLQGADLIALPTNWAEPGRRIADLVCRVRAFENNVYFLAVNRVGDEAGFHFIGMSSLCSPSGEFLARAEHDGDAIMTGTVDPLVARQKKSVVCVGEYEIDRINWRRPDLYGRLVE
ncbi:MAG: carbon-nitrogen hydrolase family protein [Gemmataceae bacterium]|nr:carbon-nitrogen hydrolase family protein [Gemmataceae bacterium]